MHQVTVFNGPTEDFTFDTPSAIALHLNSAWKAAVRASSYKAAIGTSSHRAEPGRSASSVNADSVPPLFDYFEEMLTVAFSSYAAVEAFCNSSVVEKATGPLRIKARKGKPPTLLPEEVERQIGTGEKLGRIVPNLFGLPSPSGKSVWGSFLKLEDLRNEVVHFKRRGQAGNALTGGTAEPTVLHRLYECDPFSLPEAAVAVIKYFYPKVGTAPRWLMNPTWVRPKV